MCRRRCGGGRDAARAEEQGAGFDVILLDWKMPWQSAVETARKIREKVRADVPILVLTSYDWADIEDEARVAVRSLKAVVRL